MAGFLDALSPTTIANYARGAWDGITVNSWVLAEMKKAGIFKYDVGGDSLSGPVEGGRYRPQTSAPGQDLSSMFAPKVRHARWNFTWGEKVNALPLDLGLLRRNSGDQALVRLRDTEVPAMFRDLLIMPGASLVSDILTQNGATYSGTGLPIYGLPSFLLPVGATGLAGFNRSTKASTGAAAAVTDQEVCADSTSQTYGGLSLAPSGLSALLDDAQYDAWMPTLVNAGYNWGNGANSPSGNIELFLQYLVASLDRFSQSDTTVKPNFGLLDFNFYNYLGAKKSARETVFVTTDQKQPIVPDTGYPAIKGIFHGGIMWRWDENADANSAVCGNFGASEFHVQPLYRTVEGEPPISVSGEDAGIIETAIRYDIMRRQWLVSATIPGQVVFKPRYWGAARLYKTS